MAQADIILVNCQFSEHTPSALNFIVLQNKISTPTSRMLQIKYDKIVADLKIKNIEAYAVYVFSLT